MEIDRKMASYLLEIKRSLPRAEQNKFNLSSPNIKKIVLGVHRTTTNSKIKSLAAAFLVQAGRTWEDERQQRKELISEQLENPQEILDPQQQNANTQSVTLPRRNSIATTRAPKRALTSNAKRNSEQDELLVAGILPEFLENIDISELPSFASSSSSHLRHPMKVADTLETSKSAAKSVRQRAALLDKFAVFLTTPIELSIPTKFAKVAIFLTTPIELSMPIKFAKRGTDARS